MNWNLFTFIRETREDLHSLTRQIYYMLKLILHHALNIHTMIITSFTPHGHMLVL